jgi:polyhydroxyalkanoate synthesis regulator phasin
MKVNLILLQLERNYRRAFHSAVRSSVASRQSKQVQCPRQGLFAMGPERLAFNRPLCYQKRVTYQQQCQFLPRRISMFDLMKKGMLASIGLALKTWDEVEEMVQEVQKKSEMSEVEGRKFFEDVQKKYEEAQGKLEKRVEQTVNDFLKKSNIVTADELKDLKKEIRELKQIINSMTRQED